MSTSRVSVDELVRLTQATTYHSSAATTWLLYDLVYSLQDEIALIWRSADTLPKFLYLISRYFGLFSSIRTAFQFFPPHCRSNTIFDIISLDVLSLSIEINLMLRLYALYGQRRLTQSILSVMFCGQISASVILSVLTYKYLVNEMRPFPSNWPIKGCYPENVPPISHSNWLSLIILETLLFVMLSMKCLSYRPLRDIPILRGIWRDGTMYYITIMVTIAARTISSYVSVGTIPHILAVWIWTIFSYTGARLVLNVRVLASKRNGREVDTHAISDFIPNVLLNDQLQPSLIQAHELLSSGLRRPLGA